MSCWSAACPAAVQFVLLHFEPQARSFGSAKQAEMIAFPFVSMPCVYCSLHSSHWGFVVAARGKKVTCRVNKAQQTETIRQDKQQTHTLGGGGAGKYAQKACPDNSECVKDANINTTLLHASTITFFSSGSTQTPFSLSKTAA